MRGAIATLVLGLFIALGAHGQALVASGGAGDSGGDGGTVTLRANDAVLGGGNAKAKAPKAPKVTTKPDLTASDEDGDLEVDVTDLDLSAADLDPDLFEVTARGDILVPAGTTLRIEDDAAILSTQGGVFVQGNILDDNGLSRGADLALVSLRKSVVVLGDVDLRGVTASTGGDGGDLDLGGAQVTVASGATVDLRGGDATGGGNDGGDGGDLDVGPANAVIHGSIATAIAADALVDVRGGTSGTGGGADGGEGGEVDIDYGDVLGTASTLNVAGRVDVRGGAAQAGAGSGGDAGRIRADVGGSITVSGVLDAGGGDGGSGADGGEGGEIELGSRAVGKGPITVLTPGSTASDVFVDGGAGAAGEGGSGGFFGAEADLRGVSWTGDVLAGGAGSNGDNGADGGDVTLLAWGTRASLRVVGGIDASGSDANGDGEGSRGGDVTLVALDGDVAVTGNVSTRAGHAVGTGNDADPAGAGEVSILADDSEADPSTGLDGIELLDNTGGDILLEGNITATGGNGGGGDSDGSDGGRVVIDADGDDGEQTTNGGVEIADGFQVNANAGEGSGTGASGDGGDITVRAAGDALLGLGVVLTSNGGTGGVDGTAGTISVD